MAPTGPTLEQQLYEAYGDHAGWQTFDGRDMPTWDGLNDAVRGHWRAVAFYTVVRIGLIPPVLEDFERQQIAHAQHFVDNYPSSRISGSNGFALVAKLARALRL